MAKIRERSIEILGETYKVGINYNVNSHKFTAKIPEVLEKHRELANLEEPSALNETELWDQVMALKQHLLDNEVKQRKVIVYKFEWRSDNIDRRGDGGWNEQENEVNLSFWYKIFIERSVGDNAQLFTEDDYGNLFSERHRCSYESDEYGRIEWTQENEDFMKEFYASMEKLIRKLKKFTDTPELLLQAIASKQKLLPTGPN